MITVGIAVHNEENTIEKVLNLWQAEPVDEIIIISSGSTDDTDKIIQDISRKDSRIRLITEIEKKGKPDAINRILAAAKGDIIIMTDGDVYIGAGATENLARHYVDKKVGIVAGRVMPVNPEGIFGLWMQISCDILHEKRTKNIEYDITGNLYALKKGIVKKILVNTTLDDVYIAYETKKKGYSIIYDPQAVVHVKGVKNISDFISQKTRTRVGWYQLKKNEKIKTSRTPTGELIYLRNAMKYILKPQGIIAVPAYILLNAATWIIAWWKWRTEKDYIKLWTPAKSSK